LIVADNGRNTEIISGSQLGGTLGGGFPAMHFGYSTSAFSLLPTAPNQSQHKTVVHQTAVLLTRHNRSELALWGRIVFINSCTYQCSANPWVDALSTKAASSGAK
jgi:hypothetical protein